MGLKMRNKWYSDKRALVKWSILIRLARMTSATQILQIAYFRHYTLAGIDIDGEPFEIPSEFKTHFRDIRRIEDIPSPVKILVFDMVLENRKVYVDQPANFITSFADEQCIAFPDPDTGLEPVHPNLNHLLEEELEKCRSILKSGDVIVCCRHQTNWNDAPWMELKMSQFERAIKVPEGTVKIAHR